MLCDVVLPIFTPDDLIIPVLPPPPVLALVLVLVMALALAFAALLLMLLNDLNDRLKQKETWGRRRRRSMQVETGVERRVRVS